VPLAIAIGIVVALLFVLWVAFAREPGPGPADVALAYETAWDRLDFDLLYDLSGDELRDHMRRDQFVAAKRAAHAPAGAPAGGRLGAAIAVEEVVQANQTAVVVTRVSTGEESIRNNVLLEKRAQGWTVVGYSLRE
jgi:hypothetical protein